MDFQTSILIDAPPAAVWNVMTEVESYPSWTETMTDVVRLDPGPLAIGSRVRIAQPKLGTHVWTVTAIDPGSSFTWAVKRPGVITEASHTIVPEDGGARLTLRIAQRGFLGRLVGRALAGLTQRYIETEAAGCKAATEARRSSHRRSTTLQTDNERTTEQGIKRCDAAPLDRH